MKNVSIVEKKTGKVVVTFPIDMTGLHYTPSTQEYEAAAWEAAVDQGLVDPDRVSGYSFSIENAPPSGGQSSR